MKKKRLFVPVIIIALIFSNLAACSAGDSNTTSDSNQIQNFNETDEIPLTSDVTETKLPEATASGENVMSNDKILLDYSNTADGYVMIKYLGTNSKVKTQFTCPSGTIYTYNQSLSGEFDVYPLSDGNGSYSISIYENISGKSYARVFSFTITVTLKNEFAPFLRSNKFVNYNASSKVVIKSIDICKNKPSELEKIKTIYEYVINNFTYDYELAKTVQSGYIPDLNADMEKRTGICFDYAAIMTAMLRCQGIPTKLVFGYTGTVYHAWILTYSNETGWINAFIYFNGKEWKLMDPTFASTSKSSDQIMKYIGNGTNYTTKYIY